MISLAKKKKPKKEVDQKLFPKFLLGDGVNADEDISHEDMVHDNPYSESDGANIFHLNDRSNPVYKAAQLLANIGHEFDVKGNYKCADHADALLQLVALGHEQAIPGNARDIAAGLQAIIHQLLNRVQPEKRPDYQYKVRTQLYQLNPDEIASKRNNPSAAIGSTINIVKNVLIGQPPAIISATINELLRMI